MAVTAKDRVQEQQPSLSLLDPGSILAVYVWLHFCIARIIMLPLTLEIGHGLRGLLWILGASGALLISYVLVNEIVRYHHRIPNIPGPRGWPLVGSLPGLASRHPADEYRQWAAKYGDVFQVQLGNTTAVVVNTASAARSFFISQREATNGRPKFYVLHNKVQKGNAVTSIGTSGWDHSCKRRRKVAATALNKASVESYLPVLSIMASQRLMVCKLTCAADPGSRITGVPT